MDTLDRIKGSLLGGAAGDALGYPVEFVPDHAIRDFYGPEGITAYRNGQGWISDDTQMTLFTAAGILSGDGFSGVRHRVAAAYQDWLITQRHYQQQPSPDSTGLMALPQLYARRAPGLTCLLALETREKEPQAPEDYTAEPLNDSKGCGGVMRVAPLALRFRLGDNYGGSLSALDREGAQLAAITHGHSLGYMPAAAMTHILARILEGRLSLEDITAVPHRQGPAAGGPAAGVGPLLQTGHRGQGALRQAENLPQGVLLRLAGQAIAAALAGDAVHQSRPAQQGHDLAGVFVGDLLTPGHVPHGDVAVAAVLRQVHHHPQGIAALAGNDHVTPSGSFRRSCSPPGTCCGHTRCRGGHSSP